MLDSSYESTIRTLPSIVGKQDVFTPGTCCASRKGFDSIRRPSNEATVLG